MSEVVYLDGDVGSYSNVFDHKKVDGSKVSEQQEELCTNCRGTPKLPNHWLCFHCLAHYRREHGRKNFITFGIIFLCSPILLVIYFLLLAGVSGWIGWIVMIGYPAFFIYLIFGQKLRLPPPLPVVSQRQQFCIHCGSSIVGVKFCTNCGTEIANINLKR